jgi:Phage tail assembly chaperone proteins, E, or 41 or 14
MDDTTNKPPVENEQAADSIDFESVAPVEESPLGHTLSKPIRAHGEEVRYLEWREPTAGDIERAGNPIVVDFFGEKPSLTFNEKKMSAMISELCRIPPSSVRQLTAGDWNSIAWKLVRFFMPKVAE